MIKPAWRSVATHVIVVVLIVGAVAIAGAPAPVRAAPTVCVNGICDGGKDPSTAAQDISLQPVMQWSRKIVLHVSYTDGMGWAGIDNGSPGDETWLDRSFDVGKTWDSKLGDTFTPTGTTGWRTQMYFINDPARGSGRLRACGKAGDRPEIACTAWLPACAAACDGKDPATAGRDQLLQPASQWSRNIALHVSYPDGMGWAGIDNGSPGDEAWIDRSFDGGRTWDAKLGDTFIPTGVAGWRTLMFAINDPGRGSGQIRACGKAGDRPEIACTGWLPVCQATCDGKDPATAVGERSINPLSWVWYRKLTLHVSDADHMAWASIDSGSPGDEVWIDRSWDGGATWNAKMGDTFIPAGAGGWRTEMYYFDDPSHGGSGVLRACGKASDRTDVGCTPWMRASDATPDMYQAAVSSLLARYNTGISNWDVVDGWWRSANALTALIDYIGHTGDCSRFSYVQRTFANNSQYYYGDYRNQFFDDTGWWGLAWMRAADVAGTCAPADASSMLRTATIDFDYMQQRGFETASSCGGIGGEWWSTDLKYKASIANGLFLELAGGLYNRIHDRKYLDAAQAAWSWYQQHGIINADGLVIDGYDGTNTATPCKPHPEVYTYNQGAAVGGLLELYKATSDVTYLNQADAIAQATINRMTTNGVLRENSEVNCPSCIEIGDGAIFKGVFARALRPLYDQDATLGRPTSSWVSFLRLQPQSLIANDRSGWGEYGYHWTGPIRNTSDNNAWTQASAVDAFNAANRL